jgi:hypothetical protein
VSPVADVGVPKVPFPLVPVSPTVTVMSPELTAVNNPVATTLEPGSVLAEDKEIAGVASGRTVNDADCPGRTTLLPVGGTYALFALTAMVCAAVAAPTVRSATSCTCAVSEVGVHEQPTSVAGTLRVQGPSAQTGCGGRVNVAS